MSVEIYGGYYKKAKVGTDIGVFDHIIDIAKSLDPFVRKIVDNDVIECQKKLGRTGIEVDCEQEYQLTCNIRFVVGKHNNDQRFIIFFDRFNKEDAYSFDINYPFAHFLHLFHDFMIKDGYRN